MVALGNGTEGSVATVFVETDAPTAMRLAAAAGCRVAVAVPGSQAKLPQGLSGQVP